MANRMPEVGDHVGRYLLTGVLGRGGMGTVFEARDTLLERVVALKMINPAIAADPEFRERFRREAVAMSQLDSPHVVTVHDHGEQDGSLYLVTQLVAGGDLDSRIRNHGPLSPADALTITGQVLDGLADAHRAGIVHRDVKPSNVLLNAEGTRAYLCDFGIATSPEGGTTRTGTLIGSVPYMAPERHAGESTETAGPGGDIYAAGCLLWAMLTGTPPYAGTDVEVAMGHLHGPIPQLPGDDEFCTGLNRVLHRSLAKEPAHRYPSAKAMALELTALAPLAPGAVALPEHTAVRQALVLPQTVPPGPPVAPEPAASARRRRPLSVLWAALTVFALVVAVVAVVIAARRPGPIIDALATSQSTTTTSTTSSAPLSPSPSYRHRADVRKKVHRKHAAPPGSGGTTDEVPEEPAPQQPAATASTAPHRGTGSAGGGFLPGGSGGADHPAGSSAPAPAYNCWDGSTAQSLSACGSPTGWTGMKWVYHNNQLSCSKARFPSGPQAIEMWRCPYANGTSSLYLARWGSFADAISRYQKIGDGQHKWVCGDETCGVYYRGTGGGHWMFARIYTKAPYWTAQVYADSSDHRSLGSAYLGYPRHPSQMSGTHR